MFNCPLSIRATALQRPDGGDVVGVGALRHAQLANDLRDLCAALMLTKCEHNLLFGETLSWHGSWPSFKIAKFFIPRSPSNEGDVKRSARRSLLLFPESRELQGLANAFHFNGAERLEAMPLGKLREDLL